MDQHVYNSQIFHGNSNNVCLCKENVNIWGILVTVFGKCIYSDSQKSFFNFFFGCIVSYLWQVGC